MHTHTYTSLHSSVPTNHQDTHRTTARQPKHTLTAHPKQTAVTGHEDDISLDYLSSLTCLAACQGMLCLPQDFFFETTMLQLIIILTDSTLFFSSRTTSPHHSTAHLLQSSAGAGNGCFVSLFNRCRFTLHQAPCNPNRHRGGDSSAFLWSKTVSRFAYQVNICTFRDSVHMALGKDTGTCAGWALGHMGNPWPDRDP